MVAWHHVHSKSNVKAINLTLDIIVQNQNLSWGANMHSVNKELDAAH